MINSGAIRWIPTVRTCSRIEVFPDVEALANAAADRIARLAQQGLAQRDMFRLALCGGRTPRRCYVQLRQRALDWSRIEVYFSDERCLPRDDPDRNDVMAYDALLGHVPIPPAQIHAIPAELGPAEAARAYARVVAPGLPFDLVLLGMGEDGHTASLFPDHPALGSKATVVPILDAPKPPALRVSLGLDVLNAARHKLFLVTGAGKHEALQRMNHGALFPAARIAGAQWYVDRNAWSGEAG